MSQYIVGRQSVMELLKSEKDVEKIFVLKGERQGSVLKILGKAKDKGIQIAEVDRHKLDEWAEGANHQGICALVLGYTFYEVDDILRDARERGEDPFIVVLDEIEDPHNLGAIIRTAEGAGCHGVIIPKRRSATVTSVVHKASAGATTYMKIAKVTNIAQTLKALKKEGLWVYGADGEAESPYYEQNTTGPIAYVIGNEGKGMGKLVKETCDVLVRIPMAGKVTSLNASNAAAVLLYDCVRQRYGKG